MEQSFYPPVNILRKDVPLPDHQRVYDQLFQKGSNQNLFYIWVEYKKEHTDGYQYTQFVHYFHEFVKKNYGANKLSMTVERMPGEKVYIDWIGDKPYLLVNTQTGAAKAIHVFVAMAGVSNCIYAEVFEGKKIDSFIAGTVHALVYYQAVPKYLVSDNCKTAVTKHTKDELVINAAYQDLESFYDVVVLPPPFRKPNGYLAGGGSTMVS